MSEPNTKPETWSEAATGWSEQFFKIRVYQCDSIEHLKRGVDYEKAHKNRGERLSVLTDQLRSTVESSSEHELKEAIEYEVSKDDPDKSFIGQLNTEIQERK